MINGIRLYRETDFKETPIGKIPRDWSTEKLSDVVLEAKSGFACGKRDENGILQLRMDNIETEGWINTNAGVKVPVPKNVDEYILKNGDILFNNTNSADLIGKTAIFRGEFSRCVYSNHLTRIRVNFDKAVPEWILYLFIRNWQLHIFKAIRHQHVHQAGINQGDLLGLKIPVAPLEEQQKISEILSLVDEAIHKTDEVIAKTERLKTGLMREFLTKGVGHKEFKDTELGKMPKTWEIVKFGEIIDMISGQYFKFSEFREEGVRCLKIDNVGFGEVVWKTTTFLPNDYVQKYSELVLNDGDIVLALNRPVIDNKVKVGMLQKEDSPSILYQRVGKVIIKGTSKMDRQFLFFTFTGEYFKQQLTRSLIGTDQPYARTPILLKIKIPLPPVLEQERIAGILSTVNNKLELEREEKAKLERIKQGLMDLLLAGKIRVKVN